MTDAVKTPSEQPRRIGLEPWLPWPLSAWPWWTVPVRAERVAILRIGIAVVLLWDILENYLPMYNVFYSDEGMMPPSVLYDAGRTPAWAWSLLRGIADPMTANLALLAFLGSSVLVLMGLWALATAPVAERLASPLRVPLIVWTVAAVVWVMGVWAGLTPAGENEEWLIVAAPALAFGLALTYAVLLVWYRGIRRQPVTGDEPWVILALLAATALVAVGMEKSLLAEVDPQGPQWLTACFQRFDGNAEVIWWTMILWIVADVMLLIGLCARVSAVLTWVLTMEILHLNFSVGNGGDVVRVMVLLYLMMTPCGAAWSVDAWLLRRRTGFRGGHLVPPWPLRLLFVQMTVIYCFNGIYKVVGEDWRNGTALYYVLIDPVLARFAYTQFPVPLWLLQLSTLTVLVWELGFPLWVAIPWTRKPALALGILFHLGIWLSMELGAFQPYMLTLYLPLLLRPRPGEAGYARAGSAAQVAA